MRIALAALSSSLLFGACQTAPPENAPAESTVEPTMDAPLSTPDHQGPDAERLAKGIVFFATGNEPFWSFEVVPGQALRFVPMSGEPMNTPYVEPEELKNPRGWKYHAEVESGILDVEVILETCIDDMSEAQSPYRVVATVRGKSYRGCGHFTADSRVFANAWKLASINGDDWSGKTGLRPFSLQWDPAKALISGQDGCNNFFGPGEVRGTQALIGPNLGSTMMACPDMASPKRYLDALTQGGAFGVGFDGDQLVLKNDSSELIFSAHTPEEPK